MCHITNLHGVMYRCKTIDDKLQKPKHNSKHGFEDFLAWAMPINSANEDNSCKILWATEWYTNTSYLGFYYDLVDRLCMQIECMDLFTFKA